MNNHDSNKIEVFSLDEKEKSTKKTPIIMITCIIILSIGLTFYLIGFKNSSTKKSNDTFIITPLIIKKGYNPKVSEFVECKKCNIEFANNNSVNSYIKKEGNYIIDILVNQENIKVPLYVMDEETTYLLKEQSAKIDDGNNSLKITRQDTDLVLLNKDNVFSGIVVRIEKFIFNDDKIYNGLSQSNRYYETFSYQGAHGYAIFNDNEKSMTIVSYNEMILGDEIEYLDPLNKIEQFYNMKNYSKNKKITFNNSIKIMSI